MKERTRRDAPASRTTDRDSHTRHTEPRRPGGRAGGRPTGRSDGRPSGRPSPRDGDDRKSDARRDRPACPYRADDDRKPAPRRDRDDRPARGDHNTGRPDQRRSSGPRRDDRPSGPRPFRPRQDARNDNEQDTIAGATPLDQLMPAGSDGAQELTVIAGVKPVLELMESDPGRVDSVLLRKGRRSRDTDRIIDLCRAAHVRFALVDAPSLDKLCPGSHQGVVARLFEAGFVEVHELLHAALDAPLPVILMLDQVQDPGNVGTLARTLYALGGAGLIVPRHNAAFLGGAAARTSAGALGKLPVAKATNLARALDEAIDAGYTIYGAMTGETSRNAFTEQLRTPCVVVLGNEENGIRPNVAKRCDFGLAIPMLREFDSLNVAQAGAILLGCFTAQRQGKK